MFTNYLRIFFRNMWKYKTQSLTGIFGLAFAIACFVPTLYWMRYETSYDSFYPNAAHIYNIHAVEKNSGKVNKGVSRILEKKLHDQFPAVEASAAIMTGQENCRIKKMPHVRLNMIYADSTFFTVFPQVIVSSNATQPLQILNNMVLTETVAVRLFGDVETAIGQQVQTTMNATLPPYTVTAVVKDPPLNTNLPFDAIISHNMLKHFSELPEKMQWETFYIGLYVRFNPHANVDKIAEQLRDFTTRLGTNLNIETRMLPISDVRHLLNPDVPFTLNFIGLFVTSGILLLLTAIFNFLNLHLDLFRQRIREFHLRMVNGASHSQLIRQMMFELICAILLSLLPACCLIIIASPIFSNMLDITMEMPQVISLFFVCGIGIMVLMMCIGFIIFWKLSHLAIRPQSERKITEQPILRRMAVTLQLTISIVFIVAALVVMMQMHFVNHKDLGFDHSGIIQLAGFTDYSGKVETALIHELSAIPEVESITDTNFEPQHNANPFNTITQVEWMGKPPHKKVAFHSILTDSRFVETFKFSMVEGTWWNEGEAQKVVINEEAAQFMQLSKPVGSVIRMPSLNNNSIIEEYEVVGVVTDFHTLSLRNRIHPTIFIPSVFPQNILYIRVAPGQEQAVIQKITAILPNINTTLVDVHLTPISALYNRLNRSEQVGLKIFSMLATICLLISLFGIYAVAAATTRRRRKEIAIRKIVGADVHNIVHIFFRDYTTQVIVASVVAIPLVYLAMDHWLQGYAYRTNIPWWLLTGVVTGVIVVVLLTVLGQVMKAANSNPAEVVKSE